MTTLVIVNLVGSLGIRFLYTWLFEISTSSERVRDFFDSGKPFAGILDKLIYSLTGISLAREAASSVLPSQNKIRIAIVGAGRIGAMLAEELLSLIHISSRRL